MGKKIFFSLSLIFLSFFCYSKEDFAAKMENFLSRGDFQAAIGLKESINQLEANEKCIAKSLLAIAYCRNQQILLSWESFLKAIETEVFSKSDSVEEKRAYNEILPLYLEYTSTKRQPAIIDILHRCNKILEKNPEYSLVRFFFASAYANIGLHDEFFRNFTLAYIDHPDHFMVAKTRGIACLRLLELNHGETGKFREKAFQNFYLALQREPKDASLYRLVVDLSGSKNKKENIVKCLNMMMSSGVKIKPSEIKHFADLANSVGEKVLASKFISYSKRSK